MNHVHVHRAVCAVQLLNKWWRTVTRGKTPKVRSKQDKAECGYIVSLNVFKRQKLQGQIQTGQGSVWLHHFPWCVFHMPLVKLYSDSTTHVAVSWCRPLQPRPTCSLWPQHNACCCQLTQATLTKACSQPHQALQSTATAQRALLSADTGLLTASGRGNEHTETWPAEVICPWIQTPLFGSRCTPFLLEGPPLGKALAKQLRAYS